MKSIVIGCVLALAGAAGMQDARGADTVRWDSPWRVGVELVYEVEDDSLKLFDGARQSAWRTTNRETVRILEAIPDGGFVQEWTWTMPGFEAIAGDPDEHLWVQGMIDAFFGLPVIVDLDAASQVVRLRNLDQTVAHAEARVKPVLVGAMGREIAKELPEGLDEATRERLLDTMMDDARPFAEAAYAEMFGADRLERLSIEYATRFNAFIGLDIEPGVRRTQPDVLMHALGKEPFPATLGFSLSQPGDDADAMRIEWTRKPDMAGAGNRIAEMLQELYGHDVPEHAQPVADDAISVGETGVVVFSLSTGIIELYESQRESTYGPVRTIERRRMRLVGSEREWDDAARR